MKLLVLKFFFLAIFLFTLPCIRIMSILNGQIQKYPTLHINLPVKTSAFCKASFFSNSVTYVPLETKTNCLVGAVFKIEINDSIIAISDSKKILLFNWQGKFIRQIGRTGKGPGEFILIMDFVLKGNELYITSTGKTAITKYSINGKYLGDIPQKSRPTFISSLPSGEFASYDRIHGSVIYYDNNWKITQNLKMEYNVSSKRALYMSGSLSDRFFFAEKERVLYTNYMNDTIWDITSKSKIPAYIFNLKDKLLPVNKQIEYYNGDFKRFNTDVANYQKLDILPINSFSLLLQRSWSNKTNSLYLYNKKDKSIIKYENANIYDDLTGNIQLYPNYYSINNKIVCTADAHDIIKEMQKPAKKLNTLQYNKFKTQMANLTEEDNPVVIILK